MDGVLDIKLTSGSIASFPVKPDVRMLGELDYIQDSYIASLKAGVAVKINAEGYIDVCGKGEAPLGYLATDASGKHNQNISTYANGLIGVLVGSGNQFVTDSVIEDSVTAGSLL